VLSDKCNRGPYSMPGNVDGPSAGESGNSPGGIAPAGNHSHLLMLGTHVRGQAKICHGCKAHQEFKVSRCYVK